MCPLTSSQSVLTVCVCACIYSPVCDKQGKACQKLFNISMHVIPGLECVYVCVFLLLYLSKCDWLQLGISLLSITAVCLRSEVFFDLENTVERTIPRQGPLRSSSGAFDHIIWPTILKSICYRSDNDKAFWGEGQYFWLIQCNQAKTSSSVCQSFWLISINRYLRMDTNQLK